MILRHDSKTKTCWNIVLAIVVFTVTPHLAYRLTFNINKPDGWYWFLIGVYWADIALGFLVSVKSKLKLYKTNKDIALHYFRRWFATDVVTGLPYEWFLGFLPHLPHAGVLALTITTIRLLFILKVIKIPYLLFQVQENLNLNPLAIRMINFSLFFSNAVHYMALGWIIIGASEASRSFLDQYIRSLYWCITTVATIGYGDYCPSHDSNIQIIYTMIVMIFGVGMYGYVIGNMSAIIANLDGAKSAYIKKMEEINGFLRIKNVPKDLQRRVRDYYSYMWETRKNVSTQSIISELPRSSAIDILLFLNKEIVGKVSFFKNADDIFIREIIELLVSEVYLPGDYIIRQGEFGDCMFFLSAGSVEVLVNGAVVATLHEGSPFGEAALLFNEKRNASVCALTYCDVYKLSKNDFDVLRGKYPEFDSEMKKVTDARLQNSK